MGAALALVLAGAQLSASIVSAEEMIMEDEELVPDEDDQGAYDDASTTGGQNEEELLGIEVSVDEDMDDIPLIEDDGEEVVSVGEGADLAAVAQAESEADAAAEKVKELLDGIPLQLEPADKEKIEAYLEKLSGTPSPTGSDGELEVAAYIEETMRSFGYTISEQHFHRMRLQAVRSPVGKLLQFSIRNFAAILAHDGYAVEIKLEYGFRTQCHVFSPVFPFRSQSCGTHRCHPHRKRSRKPPLFAR